MAESRSSKRRGGRPGKRRRLSGDQALTLAGIILRVIDIFTRLFG